MVAVLHLQAIPVALRNSSFFCSARARMWQGHEGESTCQAFSSRMGLCPGLMNVYRETGSAEPGFLSNKSSERLRRKRLMPPVLTFPVLLKVGFLMAGTLGAGRRGRSGAAPAVGSGLGVSSSLRSVASRASPGAPETHHCMASGTVHCMMSSLGSPHSGSVYQGNAFPFSQKQCLSGPAS